jgi:hypothetical protein
VRPAWTARVPLGPSSSVQSRRRCGQQEPAAVECVQSWQCRNRTALYALYHRNGWQMSSLAWRCTQIAKRRELSAECRMQSILHGRPARMSQVCQLHYWQHSICCIHGRHTCSQSVGPAAPCCFCCCCCVHGVLTRSALGMQPLKKPTRPSSACMRRKQSTTPLYCENTHAKTSTHSD